MAPNFAPGSHTAISATITGPHQGFGNPYETFFESTAVTFRICRSGRWEGRLTPKPPVPSDRDFAVNLGLPACCAAKIVGLL